MNEAVYEFFATCLPGAEKLLADELHGLGVRKVRPLSGGASFFGAPEDALRAVSYTHLKACMTSCFDRNNLEVPQKFRKVYEFGGGEWKADDAGAFTATAFTYYVSMTCGHCENPACVANCPTGACLLYTSRCV